MLSRHHRPLLSRRPMQRALWSAAAVVAAAATSLHAQQKPTVTAADYAKWETLSPDATLSPDGKFVAYSIRRAAGGGEAHWRAIDGTDHVVASGSAPQFSADNRWLLVTIAPDTSGG